MLRNEIANLVRQAMPEGPDAEKEEWIARTFFLKHGLIDLQPPHWRAVLQNAMLITEETRVPTAGSR